MADKPDNEDSGFLQVEKEWMARVVQGNDLVQALGSRSRCELDTVRRYLDKPHIVDRLLEELALTGQTARVNEILGYLAMREAKKALEKGDRNVILALMPSGKGPASKAAKELAAPDARGLPAAKTGKE